uniref:Uncharacterized protein n=1 Tax=Anguilla anguilla TaxID=7936 RepID=A0A0E9U9F0_ANGAN
MRYSNKAVTVKLLKITEN